MVNISLAKGNEEESQDPSIPPLAIKFCIRLQKVDKNRSRAKKTSRSSNRGKNERKKKEKRGVISAAKKTLFKSYFLREAGHAGLAS